MHSGHLTWSRYQHAEAAAPPAKVAAAGRKIVVIEENSEEDEADDDKQGSGRWHDAGGTDPVKQKSPRTTQLALKMRAINAAEMQLGGKALGRLPAVAAGPPASSPAKSLKKVLIEEIGGAAEPLARAAPQVVRV
jgi:hypothetical protein